VSAGGRARCAAPAGGARRGAATRARPRRGGRCRRCPGVGAPGERGGRTRGHLRGVILPRYHGVFEPSRRLGPIRDGSCQAGQDPEHGDDGAGLSPDGEQAARVADWMGTGDAHESSRLSITKNTRREP
jgi:hypothetical protein